MTLLTEPKSGDESPHSKELPHSEELAAALRLALVRGVGPRVRMALIERFGSPQAVLVATLAELETVPNVGHKVCQAIRNAAQEIDVVATLEQCRQQNVELVLDTDLDFPPPLKEIADPPGLLFTRGRLSPQDALAIAIVGSRHATHYGLTQAEKLAGSLARAGLTIVSGLARGIDAAAHRGALAAGGRTLAILASGVVNIYPPEHAKLAEEISGQGALISERPPHAVPKGGCFPQRNRIISGLALGVIVVEAAARSGALITARHAAEQGRDVFALPGPVDSRMSRGCHGLIREGAALIESADDVLEQLGPLPNPTPAPDGRQVQHPGELLLTAEQQQVYAAVKTAPTSIDDVITRSTLPPQRALSALSVLEMRHLIKRLSGQQVCRVC